MVPSKKRIFRLYACCIPVKGASRGTICDLQRGKILLIPNLVYDILVVHKGKGIDEIKKHYKNNYDEGIDRYFEFLIDKEYGFWTDEAQLFPDIELNRDTPFTITNAIIDIDKLSKHPYDKIFNDLDILGCQALQIRCFNVVGILALDNILSYTLRSRINSIEILLKFNKYLTYDKILKLCRKHRRIRRITFHSYKGNKQPKFNKKLGLLTEYTSNNITSSEHCGFIHPKYFQSNLQLFIESQKHNSCLNQKISVDKDGFIKNCPAMGLNYGNVRHKSLLSVVDNKFKFYWNISKDNIEVCRDCEFRYVCTDCRAFISDKNNIRSKPSRCNYDPYKAEWL